MVFVKLTGGWVEALPNLPFEPPVDMTVPVGFGSLGTMTWWMARAGEGMRSVPTRHS
jgi:hypothetical protein